MNFLLASANRSSRYNSDPADERASAVIAGSVIIHPFVARLNDGLSERVGFLHEYRCIHFLPLLAPHSLSWGQTPLEL